MIDKEYPLADLRTGRLGHYVDGTRCCLYAKLGINCEREIVSLLMSLLADATLLATDVN